MVTQTRTIQVLLPYRGTPRINTKVQACAKCGCSETLSSLSAIWRDQFVSHSLMDIILCSLCSCLHLFKLKISTPSPGPCNRTSPTFITQGLHSLGTQQSWSPLVTPCTTLVWKHSLKVFLESELLCSFPCQKYTFTICGTYKITILQAWISLPRGQTKLKF